MESDSEQLKRWRDELTPGIPALPPKSRASAAPWLDVHYSTAPELHTVSSAAPLPLQTLLDELRATSKDRGLSIVVFDDSESSDRFVDSLSRVLAPNEALWLVNAKQAGVTVTLCVIEPAGRSRQVRDTLGDELLLASLFADVLFLPAIEWRGEHQIASWASRARLAVLARSGGHWQRLVAAARRAGLRVYLWPAVGSSEHDTVPMIEGVTPQ